jgi:NAD-dependent protein deacetylase/lipoamidase
LPASDVVANIFVLAIKRDAPRGSHENTSRTWSATAGVGDPFSARAGRLYLIPIANRCSRSAAGGGRFAARRHGELGGQRRICETAGMPSDAEIAELAELIENARRGVVFTGAGISTESGIPDFRSPGGVWTRMAPIDFADFLASEDARRETWRRRFAMDEMFRAAAPNRGHRAVAELVRRGQAAAVITQNIDGLHQASGIPAERVIELHGNTTYARCLDCARRYELEALRRVFERDETTPLCDSCGGFVKTATVSFGQAMPAAAMRRAETETIAADLFIVAGSSLVVYPAAAFPELAKRYGASLVIVNREPTGLDAIADLVVRRAIGETLGAAVGID